MPRAARGDRLLGLQALAEGIVATPDGSTLIVAHSGNARLYPVDPSMGASAEISGVSVSNVDGIVLGAGRFWAVQNFNNQISVIR